MTDTDEFRVALAEAVALPGEVRPRPGAAGALRARAHRRRRVTLAAASTAVPACLVLVAVLLGGGGPDAQRATTPAGGGTTSSPEPSIAAGPRTLSTPIEIRPVLQEFLLCPDDTSGTVPAADSDNCFRLGPARLSLSHVQNLHVGLGTGANGLPDDGRILHVTMSSLAAAAYAVLTTESVGEQIAFVVDGRVWAAPHVETPIKGGTLQIMLDQPHFAALTAALTG